MKTVKGDLLRLTMRGDFDVLVHGCNCYHTMGAGIAKQIAETWPAALRADKTSPYAEPDKLGHYTCCELVGVSNHLFTVVNAYTQFFYSGGMPVQYDAIEMAFEQIKIDFTGKRIAYPLIGCGLAGGDWGVVSEIIESELEGEDHTLVIFDG